MLSSIFLFLMTALASIFTMNTLKKSDNLKLTILGLITCIFTFYFKDLSLALVKPKIPIFLAVWAPVIALTIFTFIGIIQINENKFIYILFFFLLNSMLLAENIVIKSKTLL